MKGITNKFDLLLREDIPIALINSVTSIAEYTGVSGSAFYKCSYNGQQFIVKMAPYLRQQAELYDFQDPATTNTTDTEIELLKLFRCEFIKKGATPCLIEMVYSISRPFPAPLDVKKAPPEKTQKYIAFNKTIEDYKFYADNDLSDKKIAFIVLEQCECTLDAFLNVVPVLPFERPVRTAMLFMIIHTVTIITAKYPNFRHSDMHLNNILMKADPAHSKHLHKTGPYCVFGVTKKSGAATSYYVPYYGMFPKIIDFSYSSLPEKKVVSVITQDKYVNAFRRESDIVFLLRNVTTRDGYYSGLYERAMSVKSVADLLDDIIFAEFKKPIIGGTKIRAYNI